MKSTFTLITLSAALACSISFTGCKKAEVDKDTQSSVDFSVAEMGYSGIFPAAQAIGINEDGVDKANHSCATITVLSGDTTMSPSGTNPIALLIDYGTGCEDIDGRVKTGQLTLTFHEKIASIGAVIDVTPVDYTVDGVSYSGVIQLQHTGPDTYTSTIANGECSADSWNIFYDGTSTFTQTEGAATPADPSDDVFSYTNDSQCTNREGNAFTVTTDEPLIKRNSCDWIESGVVNLTPEGLATRSFDFGDGSCDDQATVTINGNTFVFTLR